MARDFDNTCKFLAERFPREFAAWITERSLADLPTVEVLKTELGIEPVQADSLIMLRLEEEILHLEFQTALHSKPPLPLRMLDYWVRLHRLYQVRVTQAVVMLREIPAEIPTEFRADNTWHRYRVIKMWEQEPEPFLNVPALLPLASLARTAQPEQLLLRVAERVSSIPPQTTRAEISVCTQVLAGLRFDRESIRILFREDLMRESVIYQDILQEGVRQGLQQGMQQGIQQGMQQADRRMVLRQLRRRFGALAETTLATIDTLDVTQLESLGEALLDFREVADLQQWLADQAG